jgi:hypothetical protein
MRLSSVTAAEVERGCNNGVNLTTDAMNSNVRAGQRICSALLQFEEEKRRSKRIRKWDWFWIFSKSGVISILYVILKTVYEDL